MKVEAPAKADTSLAATGFSDSLNTLNLKTSYEVGEPIVIACSCAPVSGVTPRVTWKTDSGMQSLDLPLVITDPVDPTKTKVIIDPMRRAWYATPGKHVIEATILFVKTHKISVFVQDPAFPGDVTKAKLQEIEVFDSVDTQVLQGEFVQKGSVEPPPVVKVAVPNVVGMDYSAAYNALNAVGLEVNLTGPGTGNVASQIPAAGLMVNLGATVSVFTTTTPPKPPDPPQPVPTGFKSAVLTWEFSKLPKPKAATDLAVEDYLRAQCGDNWRRWDDDDGSITDAPANIVDLWKQAKTDRAASGKGNDDPWIEIELKDGKKVGRSMDDNTLQFLKSYGG